MTDKRFICVIDGWFNIEKIISVIDFPVNVIPSKLKCVRVLFLFSASDTCSISS